MTATPTRYRMRKKPEVEVEAWQWHVNGDHPDDYAHDEQGMIAGELHTISGDYRRERGWEGGVVRYYRHPRVDGQSRCGYCHRIMHDHGWLDTGGDGHTVCPGDWIVTSADGTRYPCRPDVFAAVYEPIVTAPE